MKICQIVSDLHLIRSTVFTTAMNGLDDPLKKCLSELSPDNLTDVLSHKTGVEVDEYEDDKFTPLAIACIYGHLKAVRVISEFKAHLDLEDTISVPMEGRIWKGATALFCAAGKGFLDVIKLLVSHGARLNDPTIEGCTPLKIACHAGHIHVVHYLLASSARESMSNTDLGYCLMVAAKTGHKDLIEVLINGGADVNYADHHENTALHYCVKGKFREAISLLLNHANIVKNEVGITPVQMAANSGDYEVVLLFKDKVSTDAFVEALELLACAYTNTEKRDLRKAYFLLKRGFSMRNTSGTQQSRNNTKIAEYENMVECQNLKELEAMQNDPDALHLHALLQMERLLGETFPSNKNHILFCSEHFKSKGKMKTTYRLWKRIIELNKQSRQPNSDMFDIFTEEFAQRITEAQELEMSLVLEVAYLTKEELITLQTTPYHHQGQPDNSQCDMEEKQKLLLTMIYLTKIMMTIASTNKDKEQLGKFVSYMLKSRFKMPNGDFPLHMVCDETTHIRGHNLEKILTFPDADMVSLFLDCDARVDQVGFKRYTPLHVVCMNNTSTPAVISIIQQLLKANAHIDYTNDDGKTPLQVASSEPVIALLETSSPVSLKCAAARAVRDHSISYEDNTVVPAELKEFIGKH